MKAKSHGRRKAKPTRPDVGKRRAQAGESDEHYIREQEAAIEYTRLWHQTREDAAQLLACVSGRSITFPRQRGAEYTEIVRTSLISAPSDSDAAYRKGWAPEELLDQLSGCARVHQSGVRRVLVRAYSWLVHDESEEVFDPQWITLIHKLSPDAQNLPQAIANAQMWLERYMTEIEFQVASKLLRFTKLEVVFWTQGPDAKLL